MRAAHPVLVQHDYDHGWMALVDADGEYEDAWFHHDMPVALEQTGFDHAMEMAIQAARERGERVRVWYEWPERIAEKMDQYRAARTPQEETP